MNRIAIIASNPFNIGGVGRVLNEFANMMSNHYRVDILCLDTETVVDRKKYGLKDEVNIIIDKNVSSELVPGLAIRGLRYINRKFVGNKNLNFLEYIYTDYSDFPNLISFCNSNDYVAVIGMQLRISVILGKISEHLQCKTIGWQHNTYDAYFNLKGNYYWNQHLLAEKYLNKLDRCVVLSDADAQLFDENLGVKAKRIYNPNSLGKATYQVNKLKKEKIILWVGRIAKIQKGLDYLIEIAGKLKEINDSFKLIVVGGGSDLSWLESEISLHGLSDNVKCVGATDNVEEYYSSSYMLLSTSRWEGFGLNVVEAMSFGLPIVAFDNSGPKEIFQAYNAGFVIPKYDTEKFAHSINRLLQDEEMWKKMSKSAWERSRDFTPQKIEKEWVEEIDG